MRVITEPVSLESRELCQKESRLSSDETSVEVSEFPEVNHPFCKRRRRIGTPRLKPKGFQDPTPRDQHPT